MSVSSTTRTPFVNRVYANDESKAKDRNHLYALGQQVTKIDLAHLTVRLRIWRGIFWSQNPDYEVLILLDYKVLISADFAISN